MHQANNRPKSSQNPKNYDRKREEQKGVPSGGIPVDRPIDPPTRLLPQSRSLVLKTSVIGEDLCISTVRIECSISALMHRVKRVDSMRASANSIARSTNPNRSDNVDPLTNPLNNSDPLTDSFGGFDQ